MPRYTRCTTLLLGHKLELVDAATFRPMYEEIFERNIYKFRSEAADPLFIDGGANIGLGVLYVKRLYPHARVIAFEPDQNICATLQRNVHSADLSGVQVIDKALWSSETTLNFHAEGSDGGKITNSGAGEKMIVVETVRLRDYLEQEVDFLKLDIEGAETEVMNDCQDLLFNVRNIFVEYHSYIDKPQTLSQIIQTLSDAGFRLYLDTPFSINPTPLCKSCHHSGMDMVVNIFGNRD